ncbi:MAG: transposase [Planctomycetales bacterium]|nr:transposase [Planctomycetales bacterium]
MTASPFALGGDKGYRADWIDQFLLELGITPAFPSKENQDRDARPVDFDKEAYRRRNVIERLIGWLRESRRIFSRFEKTAKNFGGMMTLVFIRQYLKYELA